MKLYNKSFVIIALAALMTQNAIAQSKQNTATQRKYNQQYAKAIRDTKNWILVTPKAPLRHSYDRKPLRNTPSPKANLEAEIDREKEEMWKRYEDFFNKAQKEQNTFREVIIIHEKTK